MNPLDIACWFDSGNYTISRNPQYWNLWIEGGPRARIFFAEHPESAPAFNKIPMVKWDRRYAYAQPTHMLLPRGLNLVYDASGGEKASGVLMHAKFLDSFPQKATEDITRRQHFTERYEYRAYADKMARGTQLWTGWSEKYSDSRQLETLGLMSKGNLA
jgi:hypothetical protein